VKRTAKATLVGNFIETITVEKDLCAIGVIAHDKPTKDSKDTGKRSQAKEKEEARLKSLTCTIKSLSNALEKLKERSSETTVSSKPPRVNILRKHC